MCEASAYATENGRICDFKMVALTKTIVYVPKVRSHMRLKYGRINFFRSHICAAYATGQIPHHDDFSHNPGNPTKHMYI